MPEWKLEILRRLGPLELSPTRETEIAEEIAQHLEDRYQELLVTGQSEDAAFRTAIDELTEKTFSLAIFALSRETCIASPLRWERGAIFSRVSFRTFAM